MIEPTFIGKKTWLRMYALVNTWMREAFYKREVVFLNNEVDTLPL